MPGAFVTSPAAVRASGALPWSATRGLRVERTPGAEIAAKPWPAVAPASRNGCRRAVASGKFSLDMPAKALGWDVVVPDDGSAWSVE